MPSSDSFDHRRTPKPHHNHCNTTPPPPPDQPEHLPCPRCDSTNTKFCYYNNYNFSQPRHFCKSCRRYWTHGGTLRDIPIGGGSRKNAKRSRLTPTPTLDFRHITTPPPSTPILFPFAGDLGFGKQSMCESFTSLLNSTQGPAWFGGGFESVWGFNGGGGDGWAVQGGDGGGNECLTLPELAISMPGMM